MDTRQSFRDGTGRQKLAFLALVAVFLTGLGIAVQDKWDRIGKPDLGFRLAGPGPFVHATREDAAAAGLRGGGRLLEVNGVEMPQELRRGGRLPSGVSVHRGIGERNLLLLDPPIGEPREVSIAVRPWRAADAWYTQGAIDLLGVLFATLGVVAFLLRPWQPASWALLSISALSGGVLTTLYVPLDYGHPFYSLYFATVVGFVYVTPFHAALAFPVLHPWLVERRAVLRSVYGVGAAMSVWNDSAFLGLTENLPGVGSALMLLSILTLVGRCGWLAVRSRERLVAQRARILLAGTAFGFLPVGTVVFLQLGVGVLSLDARFSYWMLSLFFVALVHVTLREELLNARIAVRRAVQYTSLVAVLTAVAVWLGALSPWAVALLLFPLLYLWPRLSARLDARLYPKRAQLALLVRDVGRELRRESSIAGVLKVLAAAPERLLDAQGAAAFLLPSADVEPAVAAHGATPAPVEIPALDDALVQLLVTTRKEVSRSFVAVAPQLANIAGELEKSLDALGADVLVPMLDAEERVAGGLAVGPRSTGDPYEPFELDLLGNVIQQAFEAIDRSRAIDRLRARERDLTDLRRFFPAQIIDQVLAGGSAFRLHRERKLVTVVFSDLRGFTAFSEVVEPEEVIETLLEYQGAMGRHISEYEGTLERFTGDGFMVFFNDPIEQKDHVERAVRMSLAMSETMSRLRRRWSDERGYRIDMGMGIHTGYATCGFIGYEGRRDYGVIGNVTNLAARLSDAAAPGEILISARVRGELHDSHAVEPVGDLDLKGFAQPQSVFRLVRPGDPGTLLNS